MTRVCLGTRSGPLPSAKTSTASFFVSLLGFNASYNRLSGAMPPDWARTPFFDDTSYSRRLYVGQLYGSDPLYNDLRRGKFFFDVRSNALTGTLPAFVWYNMPAVLQPAVHTEVRCPKSLGKSPVYYHKVQVLELQPAAHNEARSCCRVEIFRTKITLISMSWEGLCA